MAEELTFEEQFDKTCYEFMTIVTECQYREEVSGAENEPTIHDDPHGSHKICVRFCSLESMVAVKKLYSETVEQISSHIVQFEYADSDLDSLAKALETTLRGEDIQFVARLINPTDIRVISHSGNVDHDIIRVQKFVDDFKQRYPATAVPTTIQPVEIALNCNITLRIIQGDLTKMKCDAIVCPSSPDLSNEVGVSKDITELCGEKFRRDCRAHVFAQGDKQTGDIYRKRAEGQLLQNGVKYVIHAITPDAGEADAVTKIETVMHEALLEANMVKCKSIALPAISAEYPTSFKEICIKAFANAILGFLKTRSPLPRQIFVVCKDEGTVLMTQQTLQKYLPASSPHQVEEVESFDKIYYEFMTIVKEDEYKKSVLDVVEKSGGVLKVGDDPKTSSRIQVHFIGTRENLWQMMSAFDQFYFKTRQEVERHIITNTYKGLNLEAFRKSLEQHLRGRSIEFVARLVTKSYIHIIGYPKNLDHNTAVVDAFVKDFKENNPTGPLPLRIHDSRSALSKVSSLSTSASSPCLLYSAIEPLTLDHINVVSSSTSDLRNIIARRSLDPAIGSSSSNFLNTVSSPSPDFEMTNIQPHQVCSIEVESSSSNLPNAASLFSPGLDNTNIQPCLDRPTTVDSSSSNLVNGASPSSPDLYNKKIQPCLDRSNTVDSSSSDHSVKAASRLLCQLLSLDGDKQNDLHRAVDAGDSDNITQILGNLTSDEERLEALKVENGVRRTPLRMASFYGKMDCVECILGSVDPSLALKLAECVDESGSTAAHEAAGQGNTGTLECILKFLKKHEIYHLLKMPLYADGMTVLHIAVGRSFEMIGTIRKVVEESDWFDLLKIRMKRGGHNVLHKVIDTRCPDKVLKGLLADLDVDKTFSILQEGCGTLKNTAIHLAIKTQNYIGVREILASLPKNKRLMLLQSRNSADSTALHLAAISDDVQLFDDIEHGFEPDEVKDLFRKTDHLKLMPVFYAVSNNRPAILKRLLNHFNPSELYNELLKTDKNGSTALHLSVCKGGSSMQHLISLKDGGKYVTEPIDKNGNSILHTLSKKGNLTTLRHCLSVVPDELRSRLLSLVNNREETAYDVASSETIRELLGWSKRQEGFYYLPTAPIVLVLYSTINRDGAQEEQITVSTALPKFGLKPIEKEDRTRQQMLDEIKGAITNHISGLIVIIMSHGKEGVIEAKDGIVKIQDIIDAMCGPALKNKPKVLIVQACQMSDGITSPKETEDTTRAHNSCSEVQSDLTESGESDVGPPSTQYIASHFHIREYDVLVILATVSGGKAKRKTMIPIFVEQLVLHRNEDIHKIFLKTQKAVRDANPGQILVCHTTLCQELCLDNVFLPS